MSFRPPSSASTYSNQFPGFPPPPRTPLLHSQDISTSIPTTQSDTATIAEAKETPPKNGIATDITAIFGEATSKILGARDRVAAEIEKMKETHLVGLDWVVKELEGLHSTYEKQMSQYEGDVNNHKREIDSKVKELTVVQSQLAQLDNDKKKAVEDREINEKKKVEWETILEKEKITLTELLNAKHQEEISDLRKKYDEEKKKTNEDLIKLRTDFAAEKARALHDLRTKLNAEFKTEKTSLVNASRITLDFHSQSVYAKEVVQKLISVGAVPVDSVDKVGRPSSAGSGGQNGFQSNYSVRVVPPENTKKGQN